MIRSLFRAATAGLAVTCLFFVLSSVPVNAQDPCPGCSADARAIVAAIQAGSGGGTVGGCLASNYSAPMPLTACPGGMAFSGNFVPFNADATGSWLGTWVEGSALPTGAATQTTLASILSSLGSPFQAAGSIGNTAFGITGAGSSAALSDAYSNPTTLPLGAFSMLWDSGASKWVRWQNVTGTGRAAVSDPSNTNTTPSFVAPSTTAVWEVSPTTSANTSANPFFDELSDGTNTLTIKAASTQSVAADKSVVVQLNPNQPNLTTPLNVTPAATESHLGEVGGNLLPITNAMTTTNATTTTGQSIGGLQTLASMVRVSGSLGASGTSGLIQSVVLSFKDAVGSGPADVYFFNANPTGSTCTNDSALVLADADRTKVIGIMHVTDFTAGNAAAVGQSQQQAMPFGLSSATSGYACVVARASFVITGTANAAMIVNVLRN